ncbi:MAG: glutamyl-tRNA reductase [Oryzihumus sp.]
MSVVVLGLSHRTAPIPVLESVSLDADGVAALARAVRAGESVHEAVVVSTCNRLEVYAEAETFHGAVNEIGEALAASSGVPLVDLREHLYVHYEDRAIAHAFTVACGLDSMAVGEGQILGQLREALRTAQGDGQAGGTLASLFQQALRVGKRAHSETELDTVSVSLVEAGLARAARTLGPLEQTRVLVVGAGSMSSLAATTVARGSAGDLVVINRTRSKAQRLATTTGGRSLPFEDLQQALREADLVISCTGAVGHVLTADMVARAALDRAGRPQVLIDLALPRDVDPRAAEVETVEVVGLEELGADLAPGQVSPQLQQVQDLVTAEVAAYLTGRRAQAVAPTVAALRSRAADVVAAELSRLEQRLPQLDEATRGEVQLAVHRVVEKLLHTPTVRVKELAGEGQGGDYAQALRELFDLDPHDVAAVSVPPEGSGLA